MVCSFSTVFSPEALLNSPNSKCSVKGKSSHLLGSTLPLAIIHRVTLAMGPWVKKALKRYSYAWILSKTKMLTVSIWTEMMIFGLLASCQHFVIAPVAAGCTGHVLLAGGRCSLATASFHCWSQIIFGLNLNDCRRSSLAFCLLLGIHQGRTRFSGDWIAQLILLSRRGEAGVLPPCWQHWSVNQVCVRLYWSHMGAEYNAWQD